MTLDAIRDFIRIEILNEPDIDIGDDEDLLLGGIIDSLGVTRLIAYLEDTAKITIPPEDVTLENFQTLSAIHAYVATRVG